MPSTRAPVPGCTSVIVKEHPMKRKRPSDGPLDKINQHAAGIDIGAQTHWVAVPERADPAPVRRFGSLTGELHRIAEWLIECGVKTVAMESTGVYWIPLYEILEARGLEVLLVNARHVRNVPGRKTDVLDCQWLQQLHSFGLLRGGFRPVAEIAALRSYLRHRETLTRSAASFVHRIQKALDLMNLKFHHVLSDVTGKTGMAILRDIAAGQTDPAQLARHRHPRIRASQEQIAAALEGHYRPEMLFELRQCLELYDVHQAKIAACDREIEAVLDALCASVEPMGGPAPVESRSRGRHTHEPDFDIRSPLHRLCGGVDLLTLPGLGPMHALKLVSEVGLDLSRWKTDAHFASWLGLAPHNKISGGKLLSSRTPRSTNRAAHVFRMAAMSVSRSDTALGAFYRRLSSRIGKAKAITATARKIAVLFYRMLRERTPLRDLKASDYDRAHRRRSLSSLARRVRSLGLEIIDPKTGALVTGTVS
jgi:transposase